mgnify:CR=1 FL=1
MQKNYTYNLLIFFISIIMLNACTSSNKISDSNIHPDISLISECDKFQNQNDKDICS